MSDKVKPFKIPQEVQAALELLLRHGRRDYGGARRCAIMGWRNFQSRPASVDVL